MNPIVNTLKGELEFNLWLKENQLSYLYIDQSSKNISTLFTNQTKQPDFLVLFKSIGVVAIDVKTEKLNNGRFIINQDNELKKVLAFERVFRIPLWYVFRGIDNGLICWYWISALKALEVGQLRAERVSNRQYLALNLNQLNKVSSGCDIEKLYTQFTPVVEHHRLESIHKPSTTICSSHSTIKKPSTNAIPDNCLEANHIEINTQSYCQIELDIINESLFMDVEFPIVFHTGGSGIFSTKDNMIDADILALIDRLNFEVRQLSKQPERALTCYGYFDQTNNLMMDHLLYAVKEVLFEDRKGICYTIVLDSELLSELGKNSLKQKSICSGCISVNMFEEYRVIALIKPTSSPD